MTDEIDDAQEHIEKSLAMAIAVSQREAAKKAINHTGKCLWCGDKVPKTRRWCSAECRDAWERVNGG